MVQSGFIDRWGIDPLEFPMFEEIANSASSPAVIDASLEHNPMKLSFNKFNTIAYWPHILAANALVHPSEMKAGMQLRIPVRTLAVQPKKLKKTLL